MAKIRSKASGRAAMRALATSLTADGLLIGAMSGGDTLPQLRAAMHAADRVSGGARPHVHPRIEPAALVHLLGNAGLSRPVVDIDRVKVSYASLGRLVGDLRAMAATSILVERSPAPLSRSERAAASTAFTDAGADGKTIETFEILHFAGWRGTADRQTSASQR